MAENFIYTNDGNWSIIPKLLPLEYFLLNTLHFKDAEIDQVALIKSARKKFGSDDLDVKNALNSLINNHQYVIKKRYDCKENSLDIKSFLTISETAILSLYPRTNPGSEESSYNKIISKIVVEETVENHYCILNFKDAKNTIADVIVYPLKSNTGKEDFGPNDMANPKFWAQAVAVKIEMNPTNSDISIFANYEKNISQGMKVSFIVFSEKHKECIVDIMTENNADKESYEIIVKDPDEDHKWPRI